MLLSFSVLQLSVADMVSVEQTSYKCSGYIWSFLGLAINHVSEFDLVNRITPKTYNVKLLYIDFTVENYNTILYLLAFVSEICLNTRYGFAVKM